MRLTVLKTLAWLAVIVFASASRSDAGIITVPAGLLPGDTYRLVFVTSGTHDATSTDITVYNDFVQAQANLSPELASLGATWYAMARTPSTTAFVNIGLTTSGIYRLDGALVANGTGSLYTPGGGIDSSISIDQAGNSVTSLMVYTGAFPGAAHDSPLGPGVAAFGLSGATDWFWDDWGSTSSSAGLLPFYAISSEITVGGAAPEPGAICLVFSGALVLLAVRRRSRS